MEQIFLSGDKLILVSLLIEVGFMASLASLLITTRFYQRLLREETRRRRDPYIFGLSFGLCLGYATGLRFLIGYAGLDPMRTRHWPNEREMPKLYADVTVAAGEFLAGAAGDLSLGAMVEMLRGRAEELTDLWNAWGRIRPLLLQP